MIEIVQIVVLCIGAVLNGMYARSLGRCPIFWTGIFLLSPPFLSFLLLMVWGKTEELKAKEQHERDRSIVENSQRSNDEP